MTERQENLLAAYFADQMTEAEKAEFLSLLEEDQAFAADFREWEAAYVAAYIPAFEKVKDADFEKLNARMEAPASATEKPVRRPIFWRAFAIAASLAAVAFLGAAIHSESRLSEAEAFLQHSDYAVVAATRGSSTETRLPDGTRVCLNGASTLSLSRSFGRDAREVTLEGEGYFEVAKDAAKPFRVHAGSATVTVTGTAFNVRSYADEPEIVVSLLEGSVRLNSPSAQVSLRPGQSAVVSRENGQIRLASAESNVADWTEGQIVFVDRSIPEILASVERAYGVDFIYAEDLFAGERFTGNFSSSLSIDEILSYIDVDHKYSWSRSDDTVTITLR